MLRILPRLIVGVCMALQLALLPAVFSAPLIDTLLVVEPGPGHIRNSEGDIEVLKDGSLCLIYTQFRESDADHGKADLVQRISRDQGRTWTDPKVIVASDGGSKCDVSIFAAFAKRQRRPLLLKQSFGPRLSPHDAYVHR